MCSRHFDLSVCLIYVARRPAAPFIISSRLKNLAHWLEFWQSSVHQRYNDSPESTLTGGSLN